jgi:hypothetical protein
LVLENACMREVGLHTLTVFSLQKCYCRLLMHSPVSSKHVELCRQANLFELKHSMHAVEHRDGGWVGAPLGWGGGSGAAGPCISVKTIIPCASQRVNVPGGANNTMTKKPQGRHAPLAVVMLRKLSEATGPSSCSLHAYIWRKQKAVK